MHLNESQTSSLLKEKVLILIYIIFYFHHFSFLFFFTFNNFSLDFLFTLTRHYLNMLTNNILTNRQGFLIHIKRVLKINETIIYCTFSDSRNLDFLEIEYRHKICSINRNLNINDKIQFQIKIKVQLNPVKKVKNILIDFVKIFQLLEQNVSITNQQIYLNINLNLKTKFIIYKKYRFYNLVNQSNHKQTNDLEITNHKRTNHSTILIHIQRQINQLYYQVNTIYIKGSSTTQVNQAQRKLKEISFTYYTTFLYVCEEILQSQPGQANHNQAIVNFIKVLSNVFISQNPLGGYGPRDFLNIIERIFNNIQISNKYKVNIAFSYIRLSLYFEVTFERIIDKIRYYYQTKQTILGILLSKAYIQICSGNRQKNMYYKKILALQIKEFTEKVLYIKNIINPENNLLFYRQQNEKLQQILTNIHQCLVTTNFFQFQQAILQNLQHKNTIQFISILNESILSNDTQIRLKQIIIKIIQFLFRLRKVDQFEQLINKIRRKVQQQWEMFKGKCNQKNLYFQSKLDQQYNSNITCFNLLKVSKQYFIFSISQYFDIMTLIFIPLVDLKNYLIQKIEKDQNLISVLPFSFLTIDQPIFTSFTFLTHQLISKPTLKTILIYLSNPQFFNQSNINLLYVVINFITFAVDLFIKDKDLLNGIIQFIQRNWEKLFRNGKDDYLLGLGLLQAYLLFIDYSLLQTIFQNLFYNFLNRKLPNNTIIIDIKTRLIISFEIKIIQTFFQYKKQNLFVYQKINQIVDFMQKNKLDHEILSIFISMMHNYEIQDKIMLDIIDMVVDYSSRQKQISQIINKSDFQQKLQTKLIIKFFVQFFNLQHFKHLFQSTLIRSLFFFQIHIDDSTIQYLFDILKNVTNLLGYVSLIYIDFILKLFDVNNLYSLESFKTLLAILKYIRTSNDKYYQLKYQYFVNLITCRLLSILISYQKKSKFQINLDIIQSFSQHQILKAYQANDEYNQVVQLCILICLHQLIHYHSSILTQKTLQKVITLTISKIQSINQNENNKKKLNFSFCIGKYQLIIILLLHKRLNLTTKILSKLKMVQKVYNTIYYKQSNYLAYYDSKIFIYEQIRILKDVTQENYRLAYANVSLLAVLFRLFAIYNTKMGNPNKDQLIYDYDQLYLAQSDKIQDEQHVQQQSNFVKRLGLINKTISQLQPPQQWTNINQLKQIKDYISILKQSVDTSQWLNKLINNCLSQYQKAILHQVMNDLVNINGKYRTIKQINTSNLKLL